MDKMFEWIFVLGILYVGITSSYTDLKSGKIKNHTILVGIGIAIIANIAVILSAIILKTGINQQAYIDYFTNGIFMLIVSYFLWRIGMWTAGDAKLFAVLNILVPPSFIVYDYQWYFYGISFFYYVFSILAIYLLFTIIKRIREINIWKHLRESFNIKNVFRMMLWTFSMQFILNAIPLWIPRNYFINIMIVFVFINLVNSLLPEKENNIILVVLTITRLALDFNNITNLQFAENLIVMTIIVILIYLVLIKIGYDIFTRNIKLNKLREGMFLAELIVPQKTGSRKEVRYGKFELEHNSIFTYMKINEVKSSLKKYDIKKGLTRDHINFVRKNIKNFSFNEIRIFETMPFAQIISSGVILAIITKGNIFIFTRNLLGLK